MTPPTHPAYARVDEHRSAAASASAAKGYWGLGVFILLRIPFRPGTGKARAGARADLFLRPLGRIEGHQAAQFAFKGDGTGRLVLYDRASLPLAAVGASGDLGGGARGSF